MSDTTMFQRPNLQDLVKEAMEGTARRVDVNLEASRQLAKLGGAQPIVKQASAQPQITPTTYITKLASALNYLSKQAEEGTNALGPGKGPNALDVMAASSNEANIDAGQGGQATAGNQPPKNPPMQSSGVAKDPANALETNDDMMHGEQPVDPMGNEKTSAVYARNLQKLGFSLTPEGHAFDATYNRALQHANEQLLGGMAEYEDEAPIKAHILGLNTGVGGFPARMTARHANYTAAKHEDKRNAYNPFGGMLTPTEGEKKLKRKKSSEEEKTSGVRSFLGKVTGVTDLKKGKKQFGAGYERLKRHIEAGGDASNMPEHLKERAGKNMVEGMGRMGKGALKATGTAAAGTAAVGGGAYAAHKAMKGKEKTSAVLMRNLARLGLSKLAEDAINPAQISAGSAPAQGAAPPPGATPSEEGVPSEPSDVNRQKNLIDSNQAAIDYTKQQAKADPKSDVNKVLDEPALTSSTDKTLQETLDHTSQAGVKISSALTKTAAAQALLYKLAEAAQCEKNDAKKKEKQSQMSGLSNPSGQSGFSASSMGM